MSILLKTNIEISKEIALRAKSKRLSLNLSQQTLAQRSGVSYGSLKKFERTGQISFESLIKLAIALGDLTGFERIFSQHNEESITSIDEILNKKTRQRGRK